MSFDFQPPPSNLFWQTQERYSNRNQPETEIHIGAIHTLRDFRCLSSFTFNRISEMAFCSAAISRSISFGF